ncbi:MAG: pyridoxamine 5'-phosphate oxidase family protein [Methylococcales bacterium]
MTAPSTPELQELSQRYQALIAAQQTLLLSTASADAVPDLSYAPFVRDSEGVFYIYVSDMAQHTGNLLHNPRASVLFIRPESDSANLFARERAQINCSVHEISRVAAIYHTQLQALQDKFGEVVGILRSLPDFHLFALRPEQGRYVLGFGKAFNIHMLDGSLQPI